MKVTRITLNGNVLKLIYFQYKMLLTHEQLENHGCVLSTVATDAMVLKHQAIWASVSTVLSKFLTYPAVPDDDPAVPDIFPSGTFGSPKNSITMMLIIHFDRCLRFHVQSQRFLRVLWLCKVTARWPDLDSSMTHISVHSLVNGVLSTWTSFLVRLFGSTATAVRKVSEVTKEMKLHDYD